MSSMLILSSVAILGGIGLTFGVIIAVAQHRLRVWEDPRIDGVTELLPGMSRNCQ
jgi:Na+-translocating ferredoxin:NAD+ oxidoreductase RNF subunit RnfB